MSNREAKFDNWIARVESEVSSDVEPEAYRKYFETGRSPAEAIAADRAAMEGPSSLMTASCGHTINPRIHRDIEGMVKNGQISSFVTSETYKTMLGRSLEAHGLHAGQLALKLGAIGTCSRDLTPPDPFLRVYAPATGSPYHAALSMESSDGLFVVVVEWGCKPDPELDAVVDRLFESNGKAPPKRTVPDGPDHSRINDIRCYRSEPDGLEVLLKDAVADKWRCDLLIETSMSFRIAAGDDADWSPGHVLLNSSGIDHWRTLFACLRRALTANDAMRVLADSASFAARTYDLDQERDHDLFAYTAARRLGDAAARSDGFLPGEGAEAIMAALELMKVKADVSQLIQGEHLIRIHDACVARGHLDDANEFNYNDLNDCLHAVEQGDLVSIHIRDQHRHTRIDFVRDGRSISSLDVWSAPVAAAEEPHLLAGFTNSGDGHVEALHAPSINGGDIRAWNTFVSSVASADACLLDDDLPSSPAP